MNSFDLAHYQRGDVLYLWWLPNPAAPRLVGELRMAQMQELFRRVVFNTLIDNTDDHEKNHALLMTSSGEYELSPAFDVLPSGQALGCRQMRVDTAVAKPCWRTRSRNAASSS